ncbi:MAG: NACHT domain-containing protein [Cyanothece sp. SIO1E1]|nr:NACHT domain-containing protein [Cyanothece sp. SIO1E1]
MTGIDILIESVVSEIALPVFQSFIGDNGKNFLNLFSKDLNRDIRNSIFVASRNYERNYIRRHGQLKVLGMQEAVSLESIYTDIQFLDQKNNYSFESPETLEEIYQQAAERRFQLKDHPRRDGLVAANQEACLAVLGGPGVGKSTFLRKIGLEALKRKNRRFYHQCIPVFIELKHVDIDRIELNKIIAKEFEICGFPYPSEFTSRALSQGKLLILLDALDEAPSNKRQHLMTEIRNFTDRYHRNRFIISCRPAAYSSFLPSFADVMMVEFDDRKMRDFIKKWFHSDQDRRSKVAERCWKLLQRQEYASAKELAHTPLLLTLLCLVYDSSQDFPKNRASLYSEALDVLLKKWSAEKRIQQDPIHKDLNPALETAMLSEIACQGFVQGRFFLSQREIVGKIQDFLEENLNAPDAIDGEKILKAIQLQQGVLVERSHDAYSFSHLTFQEYLTAQYIDDRRQIHQLVTSYLVEPRWNEVFLLVAGLMRGGADDLLLLMQAEADKFIHTQNLRALLQWANKVITKQDNGLKAAAKRAHALHIAGALASATTRTYARDRKIDSTSAHILASSRSLARALDQNLSSALNRVRTLINSSATSFTLTDYRKRVRALARDLREIQIFEKINTAVLANNLENLKSKVPDKSQPNEVHQNFNEQVWQIWLRAFKLEPYLIRLSVDEANALKHYLDANLLIVRCRHAAVRVSRKTWEEIEKHMLIAPLEPSTK